ncbi:LacI family DNA-binding transcriptional regulator [Spirochaeta africana]|uniref:LacI family DNA-binding transcriptional regulator n=1 Tax=Spirochaeta africana TaxID=46355 RepID=UPI0002EA0ABA|nr:LacI family DNA-binding transcriptional regulator [Spirochaeta africana]
MTINDIARETGYSKTTVSFAFNSPKRLPQATVDKILTAAREMGYAPDPLARSMATRRTGTIGLLLPQDLPIIAENHLFNQLLCGIGNVLEKDHRSVLLVPPVGGSMADAIAGAVVDGFITWGLEREHKAVSVLEQRGVPYVMLDGDPADQMPCVNVDDRQGARRAMRRVLQDGHRQITILTFLNPYGLEYQRYYGTIRNRIEGYQDALQEFGLSLESPGIRLDMGHVTKIDGRAAMQRLWDHDGGRSTALVSMSDAAAVGAVEYCLENNIRVPEDFSVIGFDDIPEAAMLRPGLTTIAQPGVEKGAAATRILLDLLNGRTVQDQVMLETRLVERGSVGPAAVAALRA